MSEHESNQSEIIECSVASSEGESLSDSDFSNSNAYKKFYKPKSLKIWSLIP